VTPEEILIKAAEDLATHGHAKEVFFDSTARSAWQGAPACAYGAMARVGNWVQENGTVTDLYEDTFAEAARRLASVIRGKVDALSVADDYQAITGYNDADTTTAEDMILMMKEAAHG
jgi:hypothetical protein